MKKFEITSVNHRGSERKFEVIGFDAEPLESIIERLSEEAAQQKSYDADVQQIVRINNRTGELFTRFFILGADISYYLVSNSNLIRRALHRSPEFIIQDRNGRKIELHIECEVSCPPGNEVNVAQAFHSTETPAVKLNRFIEQCVNKFRDNEEHFIDNFFTLNLASQIENFIAGRNQPSTEASATYIMGLECHSVKCVWNEPEWETISINTGNFDVYFKESGERHQIIFECNLPVDDKTKINALSRDLGKADFEKFVREAIQDIYEKFISEDDIFDNFEAVKNILKAHLSEHLQKYGRRIAGLKLRDLVLERCHFLQNLDLNFKEMRFFAADRKFVEIKELLLTARLENAKAAKPHKDNPEGLKNKLKELVEAGISEFVSTIDSGEFYGKIEKPNTDFRKQLIYSLSDKTRQIIEAELTLKKIDTGAELQIRNLEHVRKYWTPFSAHIVSLIDGECSVEGSFIVTADNPDNREMRSVQEFDTERLKNKIVETLEAWLVGYSAAAIVSTNLREPVKFEQAIKTLLLDKIDEAHSVIINIQNIRTKFIDHSDDGTKDSVDKAHKQLTDRIITGLLGGLSQEEINELERKKDAIEIFWKKEQEKRTQPGNSSNQTSEASNPEENNPLLKEVNRLLLKGNTS